VGGIGGEMKKIKFDEIVAARANERVQQKISTFKLAIKKALAELVDESFHSYNLNESLPGSYRGFLNAMLSNNIKIGWPSTLWDVEKEKVASELLAIMDEMQKAMLAADRAEPGENVPCNT